jgi:hypothetical protein
MGGYSRCGRSSSAGKKTDIFSIISVFRIVAISKAHLKFRRAPFKYIKFCKYSKEQKRSSVKG